MTNQEKADILEEVELAARRAAGNLTYPMQMFVQELASIIARLRTEESS